MEQPKPETFIVIDKNDKGDYVFEQVTALDLLRIKEEEKLKETEEKLELAKYFWKLYKKHDKHLFECDGCDMCQSEDFLYGHSENLDEVKIPSPKLSPKLVRHHTVATSKSSSKLNKQRGFLGLFQL